MASNMTASIREVMTPDPVTCDANATIADAARRMRDDDIGDVLVTSDGALCGIVTDRDIVVRSVADGDDPSSTPVGEICTRDVQSLTPDDTVQDAVRLMSDGALRRVPVCTDGRVVGIVSLGDLAIDREPDSVLGDISAAPPSN
jgi:CBS domain-containing protein